MDITQKAELLETLGEPEAKLGPVQALIRCAGVATATGYLDLSEDELDKVVGINLKGAYLCTQAVIGVMIARNHGRIVIISSMAGDCWLRERGRSLLRLKSRTYRAD